MKRLLDTDVRYFDQDTFQAPKLLSSWGSLIDFLDCALVTGTEGVNVLSLVTEEDIDNPDLYWSITVNLEPGHLFKELLSVVEIKNCEELSYNQIYRVQKVGSNFIKLAVDKNSHPFKPPDILSPVDVKISTAPLGYEKIFEEPYKAVYKVNTYEDKVAYLRVDNSCPPGHDPSYLKFARVSMFSDIDGMDDYAFRLGRQKAPAYANDYTRVEENIYDIWFHCAYPSSDMNIQGTSGTNLTKYHIIGDKSTFYYTADYLRAHSSYPSDMTYIFGEYDKLTFKEDPLPFILFTTERYSLDSYVFLQYNWYNNLTRETSSGKHTFKTDFEDIFTTSTSDRWSPWHGDGYHSGANTRVNYKPYKNEIQLNMTEATLRFYRKDNTVLEGKYRGIYFLMNNLQDYENFAPKFNIPFLYNDNYFIRVSDKDYAERSSYGIQLSNWRA